MKIGVIGNAAKIKDENVIKTLINALNEAGYEVVRFPSHKAIAGVDLVIVLGGDGAILHAGAVAAPQNIPIIGINYGNVGFLTELEKDCLLDVVPLIQSYEQGECKTLTRSLLEVRVDEDVYYALNEVALQRDYATGLTSNPQILKIRLHTANGDIPISGDGALLATPTGSTAYSLSAGGAIVAPEVPVFMLTPICAFSMSARPMVFSDEGEFSFSVEKGRALLLVDGKAVATLAEGDCIEARKASFVAKFPTKNEKNFFTKIKNKLNG